MRWWTDMAWRRYSWRSLTIKSSLNDPRILCTTPLSIFFSFYTYYFFLSYIWIRLYTDTQMVMISSIHCFFFHEGQKTVPQKMLATHILLLYIYIYVCVYLPLGQNTYWESHWSSIHYCVFVQLNRNVRFHYNFNTLQYNKIHTFYQYCQLPLQEKIL